MFNTQRHSKLYQSSSSQQYSSNYDIILPPDTSIGLGNQVQSIPPIEQVHITEKEKS